MSTLTKVLIVLTSVISIALSCLFISAAAQWSNWKALAETYQSGRDAAITEKQAIAASMQAALAMKDEQYAAQARELASARDKLQSTEEENAQLKSDVAQARNEAMAFEAGRTKLQEILAVNTGELKSVQKQNQALLSQNIDLQSRGSRLNARVLELTTNVSILQDQIRNMQEKLFAAEQRVAGREYRGGLSGEASIPQSPIGATSVAPSVVGEIRGEIAMVNGVYAEINVGESSGVGPGMTFMVYRDGGMYLGDLIIESVRPSQSGGRLTTLVQGGVQTGDAVVYGLN